jgi:hypothetical protein
VKGQYSTSSSTELEHEFAPFQILLLEDNEADVLLVKDAGQEHRIPWNQYVITSKWLD